MPPNLARPNQIISLALQNCSVFAGVKGRQQIDKQVVKLGRATRENILAKQIDKNDGLIARQLAVNSKAHWDQSIPMNTVGDQEVDDEWGKERDTTRLSGSTCFYACPSKGCKNIKPSCLKCFQYVGLDNNIICICGGLTWVVDILSQLKSTLRKNIQTV